MTAKELIEYLQKYNDDALIQILTDTEVFEAEVDEDSPMGEEFKAEVCLFIGKQIG